MREEFIALAKKCGADIVGFAPKDRFDENDNIFKIFPETKTVICIAFRVLRGIYRGIEEGSTYYQYTTMAVENMEEVIMPMALVRLSNLIEENGFTALPQRLNQTIMSELHDTNPEVAYNAITRGAVEELTMNFPLSASKCGIGEIGFSGAILTDEFGPMIRYCFILTDAEFEGTPIKEKHLCDNCKECVKACPGHAIKEESGKDNWQCAVYYNGANGTKNPFFEPTQFSGFDDRIEILNGEKTVDEESAKKILDAIYCYPPASHSYQCSICGRACDMDCYAHLEEKGVLTKKFKTKFRKREKWAFDIDGFKNIK